MQVKVHKTFQVTLELTEEETEWLHAVMQNPLDGKDPRNEDPFNAQMRNRFFTATGVNNN